jgi:hypothetical protein
MLSNSVAPRDHHGGRCCVLLVLALFSFVALTASAQKPVGPTPPANKTFTQLTLRNATQDTMRVELRFAAGSCDASAPAAVHLLAPGQRWIVASSRPICWRRLNKRLPDASWTQWSRHILAKGQRLDLTL